MSAIMFDYNENQIQELTDLEIDFVNGAGLLGIIGAVVGVVVDIVKVAIDIVKVAVDVAKVVLPIFVVPLNGTRPAYSIP